MTYKITARFSVDCDNEREALEAVGACVQYWDHETGIGNLQGVGGAQGYVTVAGSELGDGE